MNNVETVAPVAPVAQQQAITLTPINGTAAYRVSSLTINDQGISLSLSIGMVDAEGVYCELAQQYHSLSQAEAVEVLAATVPEAADASVPAFDQFKLTVLNKLRALGRLKV